jgi:L-rhamnose-H+ transport protein
LLGWCICVASGLLASCGNLGFAFGGEVIKRALEQGATESMAGNSLWALITVPLFVCNAGYSFWLLAKKGTRKLFFGPGTGIHWLLAVSMGALWMAGFVCYAPGALYLGTMGSSVGWAIMMSTMAISANLWGLLTGEWRGVSHKARTALAAGVGVLVLAICVVGYANQR